jgi:predicted Zn-dependent protease
MTRDDVHRAAAEAGIQEFDGRVAVLLRLVDAYEEYVEKVAWLARNMAEEVARVQSGGIAVVYGTPFTSSLLHESPAAATRVAEVRDTLRALASGSRRPDAVDVLIATVCR